MAERLVMRRGRGRIAASGRNEFIVRVRVIVTVIVTVKGGKGKGERGVNASWKRAGSVEKPLRP